MTSAHQQQFFSKLPSPGRSHKITHSSFCCNACTKEQDRRVQNKPRRHCPTLYFHLVGRHLYAFIMLEKRKFSKVYLQLCARRIRCFATAEFRTPRWRRYDFTRSRVWHRWSILLLIHIQTFRFYQFPQHLCIRVSKTRIVTKVLSASWESVTVGKRQQEMECSAAVGS